MGWKDRLKDLGSAFGIYTGEQRKALTSPDLRGGWFPVVRESFAGAWQQNVEVSYQTVLASPAVFSCQTLIAGDIAKLGIRLVEANPDGIWLETTSPAFSPVLRKPNPFQTWMQFCESWMLSKLQSGNTYILKARDQRNVVLAMYVLDPTRVRPLVADTGDIFYELNTDHLSGVDERLVVPARDIIHDRFNCMFHPLVGISPIFANGIAAMQASAIQNNSAKFFANNSQPGGILTAPGEINDENAARLKEYWETSYANTSTGGFGKIAVLGDGLKFEALAIKAEDAQLIEQLKWTSETICSTYHVPPYKIGIGSMPTYSNVQSLNVEYYSQALQVLIVGMEGCLNDGMALPSNYRVDILDEELLRMDSLAQMEMLDKGRNYLTPNEGRLRLGLPKTKGGDSVYRQHQDYSLEALAKRDAKDDPFATDTPDAAPSDTPSDAPPVALPTPDAQGAKDMIAIYRTALGRELDVDADAA